MEANTVKLGEFARHIALYAKGHYGKGHFGDSGAVMEDLREIIGYLCAMEKECVTDDIILEIMKDVMVEFGSLEPCLLKDLLSRLFPICLIQTGKREITPAWFVERQIDLISVIRVRDRADGKLIDLGEPDLKH